MKPTMMQRSLLLLTMWVCLPLYAQDYPAKPARMIVAFSPGVATDLVGRAVGPHIYKNPGYDALRDFSPVALAGRIPLVMAAHSSLPIGDVKGLITLARQRPGQLFFSSSGTGTTLHLAGELFKSMANIEITHIPYKGASLGVIDLVGGQVQLAWISLPTAMPRWEASSNARALSWSRQPAVAYSAIHALGRESPLSGRIKNSFKNN